MLFLLIMLISLIENVIYNNKCRICKKTFYFENQNLFCADCLNEIKKTDIIYCKSCGKKTTYCIDCLKEKKFNELRIFTTYSLVLREIINYYKFKNYKNLSSMLADIIKEDFLQFVDKNNINFILYVPSSKSKIKERGFEHLYEILSNLVPKSVIRKDLIKIKETKLQVDLTREERLKNLENAFQLKNPSLYEKKNVLIFDDIITTGSSLLECFKTVKKAHPKSIYGYVIAC